MADAIKEVPSKSFQALVATGNRKSVWEGFVIACDMLQMLMPGVFASSTVDLPDGKARFILERLDVGGVPLIANGNRLIDEQGIVVRCLTDGTDICQ